MFPSIVLTNSHVILIELEHLKCWLIIVKKEKGTSPKRPLCIIIDSHHLPKFCVFKYRKSSLFMGLALSWIANNHQYLTAHNYIWLKKPSFFLINLSGWLNKISDTGVNILNSGWGWGWRVADVWEFVSLSDVELFLALKPMIWSCFADNSYSNPYGDHIVHRSS